MEAALLKAKRGVHKLPEDFTMTETDQKLLEQLSEKFSAQEIKQRKGPKNKMFSYVSVHHIRERLDKVLGFRWNWEVVETRNTTFIKSGWFDRKTQTKAPDEEIAGVTVTGRLSIQLPSGITVYREGSGGASCDKGMGPGDAEKIASSNALKRAAWMFGIGKEFGLDGEEAMDDVTVNQSFTGGNGGGIVNPVIQPAPAGGSAVPPGAFVPGIVQAPSTGGPVQPVPATIISSEP